MQASQGVQMTGLQKGYLGIAAPRFDSMRFVMASFARVSAAGTSLARLLVRRSSLARAHRLSSQRDSATENEAPQLQSQCSNDRLGLCITATPFDCMRFVWQA